MGFFDISLLLMIPAMILAAAAQAKITSTYRKYSQVPVSAGLTGAQVAQRLMAENGIRNVSIGEVPGNLTDHYDPRNKRLGLSWGVYGGTSVAALGVAAHEIGHALQDAQGSPLLRFRNAFAPVAQLGSNMAIPLVFIGLLLGWVGLAEIGIMFFMAVVIFQLITVPVELDASRKALTMLREGGYMQTAELTGAKKVLNAAALTYIASLVVALANLLRLVLLVRNDS